MTIFGLGSDIIDISRIKRAFKNKNFKKKIFSKNEIKTSDSKSSKISSYAKKFAAKEAFSKALGTGISGGISPVVTSTSVVKPNKSRIELLYSKLDNKRKLRSCGIRSFKLVASQVLAGAS